MSGAGDVAALAVEGKVVVLTGASSGIGEELTRSLHAAGARLVVGARREQRLRDLAGELDGLVTVTCDVAVEGDRKALIGAALDRYGRIDGLVNNAGTSGYGDDALAESLDEFRRQIEINLVAPFALAKAVAPGMRDGDGGSIVNISSISGLLTVEQVPEAAYVVSKTGLLGLTRELASQWGRYGIRVNALAPGFIPTEMTEPLMVDGEAPEWITRPAPLGRAGLPAELVGAVQFLLSDSSSFVTGQTLVVDGGVTIR